MRDAEFIYSLYVQANPVPDADLLPLTRDEAALLTSERSQDMITEEPVETRPAPRRRRRRSVAALGAFAAVIVIGLVAGLLVSGDDGPVAASDANPVVTFDGETCSYDGPTQIEEGAITFTIANSADLYFGIAAWRMEGQALLDELERAPIGTNWAAGGPSPNGTELFGATSETAPGETHTRSWSMLPGTYLLDCGAFFDNISRAISMPNHLWRVAQLKVVASG